MIFRIIYSPYEHNRVIPAVIIDCRATIPDIKNATGSVIKEYIDPKVYLAATQIFYKIESENGSLAGYFTLGVNDIGVPVLDQFQLRPAFAGFMSSISAQIANFMSAGTWRFDTLLN